MNKVYVACAGSGKTTLIVDKAMKMNKNVLITTFTDSNCNEIENKFIERYGYVSSNISIIPWFTFQLDHLIRPYQPSFLNENIENVYIVFGKSSTFSGKNNKNYYLINGSIYSDKIASLAYDILNESDDTLNRLKRIFDYIFIDEFQDFAGYDLEIIKHLSQKGFSIEIVCDPRQHTFSTHYDLKNHRYACEPLKYIQTKCNNYFEIDETTLNGSYRCPQNTIRYASEIFPDLPQSNSNKSYEKGDGIIFLKKSECEMYLATTQNVLQLRDSKKTYANMNYAVSTFGKAKGLTVENTIIYPTASMLKAIISNDFSNYSSKSDLYVALTRAKHKTAIVVPDKDFIKYEKVSEHINSYLDNK